MISSAQIHKQDADGNWNEISDFGEPETINEAQASIDAYSLNSNNEENSSEGENIDDEPDVELSFEESNLVYKTIGSYISEVDSDELRIQNYTSGTTQAYSLGYVKIPFLNPPTKGDRSIVTKATLSAYCSTLSGSKNNVVVAKTVTGEWPSNNISANAHPVEKAKILDHNDIEENDALYEWDITEAACLWSNGTIENYGIALAPEQSKCKVSVYVSSAVLCYEVVNALESKFSYHSVDMGRAGTVYVNDYTNDLYLVRNELAIDSEKFPVNVTRTFNNANNGAISLAGSGWNFNYSSKLARVGANKYKWTLDDGTILYFTRNTSSDPFLTQDYEKNTYELIIDSNENIITCTSDNESNRYHYVGNKLTKIEDCYGNTINISNTSKEVHIKDSSNRTFNLSSEDFDGEYLVCSMTVNDSSNEAISLDGEPFKLTYKYDESTLCLEEVTYSDYRISSSEIKEYYSVNYGYDNNGNLTSVKNIDGTILEIVYDNNNKVESYVKKSKNNVVLDKCIFDDSSAYLRVFTDKNGDIIRQQYDSNLNIVSSIQGDYSLFYTYNTEQENIALTQSSNDITNLLDKSGDFSESTDNWVCSSYANIIEDNDVSGYKDSLLSNNVMQIEGDSEGAAYAYQRVSLSESTEDKIYTIGAWVKVNNGSKAYGNKTIGLIVDGLTTGASGNTVTTEQLAAITFNNSCTDWQYMMTSFVIPKDLSKIQITLSYNYQVGYAEFDGITFYEDKNAYIEGIDRDNSKCNCDDCSDMNCSCNCENPNTCECVSCQKKTTTERNEFGQTTSIVTTNLQSSMLESYSYTSSGNYLLTSTDSDGVTTHYYYDETTGLLKSLSLGDENNKVNYAYNAVGLLKSVSQTITNVLDNSTVEMNSSYLYDGDTLSYITHNGMKYSFEYDDYGNVNKVSLNNSSLKTTNYVNSGQNIGNIIYANGDAIVYEYDDNGNISKVYSAKADDNGDFQNKALKYEYSYDNGKLTNIKDYVNSTITKYTDDGYTVSNVSTDDDGNTINTLIYSCSSNDSAESYSFNVGDTKSYKIAYTTNENQYDADYGITTNSSSVILSTDTTDDEGNTSTVTDTYSTKSITDYFGRTVSNTFGENDNQISTTYTYKTNGYYTTNLVASSTTKIGSEEYKYEYEYDTAGRLIKKSLNGELIAQYSYDEAGQLVRENNPIINITNFNEYDNGGNITHYDQYRYSSSNDLTELVDGYIDTGFYNNDKLVKYTNDDISYDLNGNIVEYEAKKYTWKDNLLISVLGSNIYVEYQYNDDNLRTSKKVYNYNSKTQVKTLSYTIKYNWEQTKLISTEYISNGKKYNYNYYSFVLYDSSNSPIGFRVKSVDSSTNVDETYYYVKDTTGQINNIIQLSTKQSVVDFNYDAWGFIYSDIPTDIVLRYCNPFIYKDYIYDEEIQLYYCQSRYYSPYIQRFISMDSIYDTGSSTPLANNTYIYCENDPVNNSDAYGRISTLIVGLVIDVAITVINPTIAATYDTLGNLLKAYYRSKGRTYAVNYIKNKIVPVFTHSFMNNFLTAIRRAIQKVCGATLNNLGSLLKRGHCQPFHLLLVVYPSKQPYSESVVKDVDLPTILERLSIFSCSTSCSVSFLKLSSP